MHKRNVLTPSKTFNLLNLTFEEQENAHQEVALLVAGDFNLDHLYSTHRDAYKALPCPTFGKSDHNSIPLIPAYKLKIKAASTSDSVYKKVVR